MGPPRVPPTGGDPNQPPMGPPRVPPTGGDPNQPPTGDPNKPPAGDPNKPPPQPKQTVPPSGSYLTVDPNLKAMMDRLRKGEQAPVLMIGEDGKMVMLHTISDIMFKRDPKKGKNWLEAENLNGTVRWVGYKLEIAREDRQSETVALDTFKTD